MGRDKLSLPLHGATVLEHVCAQLARVAFEARVLVARSRRSLAFDPEMYRFDVVEIGEEAEAGMHRSLKCGLARLPLTAQAAMVCLGDQPFVKAAHYEQVRGAYAETLAGGRDLLYPTHAGNRGNPAVLHRRYFAEIQAEPDSDRGCRYLFERYPDRTRAWETAEPAFFRDLDTPEEYDACKS